MFFSFSIFATDKSISSYQKEVEKLLFNGEYVKMKNLLINLLKENPKSEFYTDLGTAYLFLKDFNNAKKNFEKAIKTNKNFANAYNGMGTYYLAKKEYKSSIPCFLKAISLDYTLYMAIHNLGYAYNMLGKYDLAIKYLQKSINSSKNFQKYLSYSELSFAYLGKNNYKEALKSLDNAIKIKKDYYYYINKGDIYNNIGIKVQALKNYFIAQDLMNSVDLKNDFNLFNNYKRLALIFFKEKYYKKSLKALDKAISIKKDSDILNLEKKIYKILKKDNQNI